MATRAKAARESIDSEPTTRPGESCPECGGRVESDSTESACVECGLVLEDSPIDHGPEWRSYNDGEDRSRVSGVDRSLHDRGLGSEIGTEHERTGDLQRQNQWNRQAKTPEKKDRGRGYATGEIHRIGHALELGDSLIKQAKRLFRDLHESGSVVGHDMDTLAATAVYTVTRVHQRGLTPGDIAAVARAEERPIMRRHKWLCSELDIGCPPPDPRQRLRVVARECGLDRDTVERALGRLDGLPDGILYSGSPSTIVAAVLYDELGGAWSQERLGEAAGCSPVSIRNRLGDLEAVG